MNFLKKLFKIKEDIEYVYQNNKLIKKGENRELTSFMQFGVCCTSYFFDLNFKLISEIINKNVPIVYLSDDSYESNFRLIPLIKEKNQDFLTSIDIDYSLNRKNTITHDLFSTELINYNLKNKKHIFFVPEDNSRFFTEERLLKFRENFFITLENLTKCDFNEKVFVILNFKTDTFEEKEIDYIHNIIKELKNKNIICLTCMSDYGLTLDLKNNIFGEEGIYDEFWIWNLGEGIEIYPYLDKVHQLPFFNNLPKALKYNFLPGSDFLEKSYLYFKNGNIKYQGFVIFDKNKWFYEQY